MRDRLGTLKVTLLDNGSMVLPFGVAQRDITQVWTKASPEVCGQQILSATRRKSDNALGRTTADL